MRSFILLAVLVAVAASCPATVLHVPGDYSSIQSAIDAAAERDTVLVASGTYYENVVLPGRNLTLASDYVFSHDSLAIAATVLDGSALTHGESQGSVVSIVSGGDSSTRLVGLTIQRGVGSLVTDGVGVIGRHGGGVLVYNSGATIEHCAIRDNTANLNYSGGGGIYAYRSRVIVHGNSILQNQTTGFNFAYGGGIFLDETDSALVEDNQILFNQGAGIWDFGRNSIYRGNKIRDNIGEGIYTQGSSTVTSNIITNNDKDGVFANYCSVYMERNVIAGCDYGVTCRGSDMVLFNNTIAHNRQTLPGAAFRKLLNATEVTLSNNIFWDRLEFGGQGQILIDSEFSGGATALIMTGNDIRGGQDAIAANAPVDLTWGDFNFDADPLFCAPATYDLTLAMESPCLPANSPGGVLVGALRLGCSVSHLRGDVDGDGMVSVQDLAFLTDYYFRYGPSPVPLFFGDVNNDGAVNLADILVLADLLMQDLPAGHNEHGGYPLQE